MRPLDVFGLFRMEYDSPLFIAAIKKIVRNFLNSLKQQQQSANEHQQAGTEQNNRPRRVVSAELATPVPITVHTKSQDNKSNWDKVKTAMEIIGILAAIIYAGIAALQLREIRKQTNSAGIYARGVRRDAAEELLLGQRQLQIDQRAWIGIKEIVAVIDTSKPFNIDNVITNFGKTPAFDVSEQGTVVFKWGPRFINVAMEWEGIKKKFKPEKKTFGVVFPGATFSATTTEKSFVSPELSREAVDGAVHQKRFVYSVGTIEYRDIFGKLHNSRYCARWVQEKNGFDYASECSAFNTAD